MRREFRPSLSAEELGLVLRGLEFAYNPERKEDHDQVLIKALERRLYRMLGKRYEEVVE